MEWWRWGMKEKRDREWRLWVKKEKRKQMKRKRGMKCGSFLHSHRRHPMRMRE